MIHIGGLPVTTRYRYQQSVISSRPNFEFALTLTLSTMSIECESQPSTLVVHTDEWLSRECRVEEAKFERASIDQQADKAK